MIPILFNDTETQFTTNGLGALTDALAWTVSQELDGLFEMEMEYPASGAHAEDIQNSRIIYAEPSPGASPQAFRVYRVTTPLNGRVKVYAQHITYQANWIPVMPFTASSLAQCLQRVKTYSAVDNPFTFWTDKTVATGIAWTTPMSLRAMLGGTKGSVLDTYGGDYEWDNWTIKLHTRRGADNGVRIAYGKNLIDAKQEANIGEVYTGVCPYWSDEETGTVVTLPEKYILASTAGSYPFSRVKTIDFSSDFDEQPTVAALRARTQQYIAANHIGIPRVSIDVNMAALWASEEFRDIAPLEEVSLGDTVHVDIERLGISTTARVVSYVYDGAKGRYKKLTIGDASASFAKTFVDQGHAIEESLGEAKAYTGKAVAAAKAYSTSYTDSEVDAAIREAEQDAQELVENATSWLTAGDGYVVARKNADGSWKELLFMDSPSTSTAVHVLRINENGIGFSRNGVSGQYKQAWTLDGRLVVGGTDAATIAAINGSNQEIFGVTKDGISWLLKSSIMTKNGTLYFLGTGATASSGNVMRLNNGGLYFSRGGYNSNAWTQAWRIDGTLTVGGTDNVKLSAVNAQNKEIFGVTKDGISWTMAQSIMKKNGTLYFLGNGATANSGNVLRMSSVGIGFSRNGYNGSYTQSWGMDGTLTLGGSNNAYGTLMVMNANNRAGMELYHDGLYATAYTTQGLEDGHAELDGSGLTVYAANSDESAMVTPNLVSVTDEDGNAADLSGTQLSVAGVLIYDDSGTGVVEAGEVRGEIQPSAISCLDDNDARVYGVSDTLHLPGGWVLQIINGVIVDVTQGATGWEGYEGFMLDGQRVYFDNGVLAEVEDT